MWLLDTHTLTLHFFLYPESVREGYLILSHVWNDAEQSFQDVQRIHERCDATGEDPHDLVSPKIRKTCELAERHGYKWAWIDTCCIDKTSSAELMETINAMYKFYALALVCYVYLGDMRPTGDWLKADLCNPHVPKSDHFSQSKWNSRGWTLQELIAPRVVYFLSMDWKLVGNKEELADGLELVTGIPAAVLRFQQKPDDFSVAQRMSWAAKRETTRVEDEAYCLLGIFNVNMPTLYGEGKKAFGRLQEAILAQTTDTTLFAWGRSVELAGLDDCPKDARAGLLATSPFDYESSSAIRSVSRSKMPERSRSAHGSIQRNFNITPHGILARIPVVLLNGHTFADLSWDEGDYSLLLLLKLRVPKYIGALPLYDVGVFSPPRDCWDKAPTRLSQIYAQEARNDSSGHKSHLPLEVTWKLLYLQTHSHTEPETPIYLPVNHAFPPMLRLPEHLISKFLHRQTQKEYRIRNSKLSPSWNPPLTITFLFQVLYDSLYVAIQFGRCDSGSRSGTGSADQASFWSNFRGSTSTADCGDGDHECPADHILTWPHLEQKFMVVTHHVHGSPQGERDMRWILNMSFTQSPTGTGPLILSHISIEDHTLLKRHGYRDWVEEWDMERQAILRNEAALVGKEHDHTARVACGGRKGQEVRPCATNPEALPNSQDLIDKTASERPEHVFVPPHRRIIRFLTKAIQQPRIYSCVLLSCIIPSQEDCFLPPLSAYLYDLSAIKPTALYMCNPLLYV